ncbi:MAG: hypothetical protein LBG98_00885 [Puniceicoccales bacterium]|jgi:hypothetical protein|nr:hypothetical protein [Puniceicoccales bacterium]
MAKDSENPITGVIFNITLPAILMSWLDDWTGCSPALALVVALMLPLGFGLRDFWRRQQCSLFSIIGLLNVVVTGGIGLWQLPKDWIAIKEATEPIILGAIVLASLKTSRPVLKMIFLQRSLFNVDAIEGILADKRSRASFDRLIRNGTWMLILSFLLSSVLNFVLARYFIHSETGTPAFNKEMGKLIFWGHPIILFPCTLVFIATLCYVVRGIQRLTGLEFAQIFSEPLSKEISGKD